jgi:G3E family GTPase
MSALRPERSSPLHPDARYIMRKQLEEADIIIVNKQDLLTPEQQRDVVKAVKDALPDKEVYLISALTGTGVAAWLDAVWHGDKAGKHITDVDYDTYASGEAVLGWLNASTVVTARAETNWRAVGLSILVQIRQAAAARQAEIAHVKVSFAAATGQCSANLTSTSGMPVVYGNIPTSASNATLIVNARVEMAPETLRTLVTEILHATAAAHDLDVRIETLRSFRPGRPNPTHRYNVVV